MFEEVKKILEETLSFSSTDPKEIEKFRILMLGKKGKIEELVKILVVVLVLVTMATVTVILTSGGGGKILDSMKSIFRFGR